MTSRAAAPPPRAPGQRGLDGTLYLWAFLLALALTVLLVLILLPDIAQFRQSRHEIGEVQRFQRFIEASEMISRERAPSNLTMSPDVGDDAGVRRQLAAARRDTDLALAALQADPALLDDALPSLGDVRARLARARQVVDRVAALPPQQRRKSVFREALAHMLAAADLMRPVMSGAARQLGAADPAVNSMLQVAGALSDLREYCGRLGSLVMPSLLARERLDDTEMANINVVRGRIIQIGRMLDAQSGFGPGTPLGAALTRARTLYFGQALPLVLGVAEQGHRDGTYAIGPAQLTRLYLPTLQPLEELDARYLQAMAGHAAAQRRAATHALLGALIGGLVLVGCVVGLLQYLRRMVLAPLVLASRTTVALAIRDGQAPLPHTSSRIAEIRSLYGALGVLAMWIGERNQMVEHLKFQARTDQLTGLPNRSRFAKVATSSLHIAQQGRFGLLYIDLDDFKQINDALGHHIGDELLTQVARRLAETVSDRAFVARLGGDEFAACCVDLDIDAQIVLANDILRALSAPFILAGSRRVIGASVGIAPLLGERADYAELCQQADIALYEAKAAGRNTYRVFSTQTLQAFVDRSELKSQLAEALAARQFSLAFQPVFELDSGAVVRCEALMRWQHPERGAVSPSVFVPLLESGGLIDEAGSWLVREASGIAATWPEEIGVSINVSPLQLLRPGLAEEVRAALVASGLAAHRLQIEITESSLIAPTETTSRVLDELRAVGVGIAIDDFGTGYSSFSYLRDRRFDTLKIDRSFIEEIGTRADTETILRSVIELARSLGMRVVAEGVETTAQLAWLRAHRCDYVQGYLLAEPMPAQQLPARFRTPP